MPLYLNFKGTIHNRAIFIIPVNYYSFKSFFPQVSVCFLLDFELDTTTSVD